MYENLDRKRKGKKNPILELQNKKDESENQVKSPLSEAQKKQRKRRNIKVYDEAFFDVVALSKLKDMTQNDLLRYLVKKEVDDLAEKEKSIFEYLRSNLDE